MEAKKTVNLIKHFREERLYLAFLGYYPLAEEKYKIRQRAAVIFFTTVSSTYFVLGCVYAAQSISNIMLFSEICAFLLTDLALMIKMLNLLYHRKNITLLENILRDPLFTEVDEEEENIIWKSLNTSRWVKILSAILIFVNLVFQISYPLIYKKFFLLMWFPFDPEKYFVKVYFFELLVNLTGITFGVTLDVLTVIYLDLCAVQFVLLRHRLVKLETAFTGDEVEDNRIRVKKLKKYIIHHNYIYSFCKQVQETLSIGMFFQILCSSLIICFSLFQVLVTPVKSIQFGLLVAYTQDMLWQLSTYCFLGQKVVDSSDEITKACYMSKWYGCSLEVQKLLAVIMVRSNTPVKITAGGIFPLTLETLMTILSSAYSFFAIIWKMYNEN